METDVLLPGGAEGDAKHRLSRPKRPEIEGLRAVAVLAVVFFHAGLKQIPGGFLGVDVFFVISGFLISGNILRDITDRRFSFKQFYARRVIRLYPASTVAIVATLILSFF
jgi:peptidoglycan/LPS O-acetylase OafA/YrhL